KGISAIIATIMLLMITVALIGVFYVFSSTMVTQTTSSGGERVSQITSQLSSCMQIRHITGNQVTLENCGRGVIENKSLVVMMDDAKLGANANTIAEGENGIVNVSGLWQIAPGTHNLKINNGAAFALALVDVQPNKDGLVGSWNFDEGSGTSAYDASGNGNVGTLNNGTSATCFVNGACPDWTDGKFGKALSFDGIGDYVKLNSDVSTVSNSWSVSWFMKRNTNTYNNIFSRSSSSSGQIDVNTNNIRVESNTNNFWQQTFASGITIADGSWHNYFLMFGASGSYLFVDGVLMDTKTQNTDAANFVIRYMGRAQSSGYGTCLSGQLDEVRVWNRALAPDETVTMKQLI
ncbi:MAG: hypothetical protein KKB25_02025, partial [Nanoarchaeota archaeon]|nr:hypothetical protein [Nanoarchaeota archaeon]